MTPARLNEYVETYDVDLTASCVVIDGDEPELIMGLGMLGVRDNRTWITRVGVLPFTRKLGAGGAIITQLIETSKQIGHRYTWLEVIAGNEPAYRLFMRNHFVQTRELAVLRRPPGTKINNESELQRPSQVHEIDVNSAISHLFFEDGLPNWLNQPETLHNVVKLEVVELGFKRGWCGRVFYEPTALQLKRVIVQVMHGPSEEVSALVLAWLHSKYPMHDAVCENFEVNDPLIQGYLRVGYFESFHRIEMVRDNTVDSAN
ncbi:MAG: GNAT family N-acetyltransferase [Chloroflexota bacterium]